MPVSRPTRIHPEQFSKVGIILEKSKRQNLRVALLPWLETLVLGLLPARDTYLTDLVTDVILWHNGGIPLPGMLRKADSFAIFYCLTREANLAAAKHALRLYRGARLHRQTGGINDVIDVVVGIEIMERYVCRVFQDRCSPMDMAETPPAPTRVFKVEDLALYR